MLSGGPGVEIATVFPDDRQYPSADLLRDEPLDGDLGIFLAEENAKMLFGMLTLYSERQEVHFEHALLGDYLSQPELELAVHAVAFSTNQYDDLIKQRWGGRKRGETRGAFRRVLGRRPH